MSEMGYWQSGLTGSVEVAGYRVFSSKSGLRPKVGTVAQPASERPCLAKM
jgi:hypothetical protein